MYTKAVLLALIASLVLLSCESYRLRNNAADDDSDNDDIDTLLRQLEHAMDHKRPSSHEEEPLKPQKPSRQLPKDFSPNCRRWSLC